MNISNQTRLETLILYIFNNKTGNFEKVRAFLDRGSNISVVSSECALRCGLDVNDSTSILLSTFGNQVQRKVLDKTNISFYKDSSFEEKLSVEFFIMDKLIDKIKAYKLSSRQCNYINDNNLILADPEANSDGFLKIDLLLGQNCVHQFTKGASLFLPGGSVLLPTWDDRFILAGPLDPDCLASEYELFSSPKVLAVHFLHAHDLCESSLPGIKISNNLKNNIHKVYSCISSEEELEVIETFRNFELLGISPLDYQISPIQEEFNRTTVFDGERYEVRLPFKKPQILKLSNNFLQAFQRLMSGVKRRSRLKYTEEKEKYEKSFNDEIEKGILEKVCVLGTVEEILNKISTNPQYFNQLKLEDGRPCCYLPHQAVYKQSNGKFRRVHDGKAKPYKGAYSVNDCLEKGPNLMSNILYILLGFRQNQFAAKADIEKAFPQVKISLPDRDVLRCLWVENGNVVVYRFARLPFGLSCSPFILAATLQKHLVEYELDEKTIHNFIASLYVDDSVWSERLLKELFQRKELYTELFKKCGMNFRDWNSNSKEARDIFAKAENRDPILKETVLGLLWDVLLDSLRINSERLLAKINKKLVTKRDLWKIVPSIYDPLGLLSPYVLRGRRIISDACKHVKCWDGKLPQSIIDRTLSWAQEFPEIEDVVWNRFAGIENPKRIQLYGCSDASKTGLGACIYLVSTDQNGKITSNLILSKTRNESASEHSIPRLELAACVLLLNILEHARKIYHVSDEDIVLFTDNSDCIFWIYSGHYSWKPFIANQLKKLVTKGPKVECWRHIDGTENPADLASRGATIKEVNTKFWKKGPDYWESGDLSTGKSNLSGYDQHFKDLPISAACEKEIKKSLKRQIEIASLPQLTVSSLLNFNSTPHITVSSLLNFHSTPQLGITSSTVSNKENCEPKLTNMDKFAVCVGVCVGLCVAIFSLLSLKVEHHHVNNISVTPVKEVKCKTKLSTIDSVIDINKFEFYENLISVTDDVLQAKDEFKFLLSRAVKRRLAKKSKKSNKIKNSKKPDLEKHNVLGRDLKYSNEAEVMWIQATQRKYFSEIFLLIENPNAKVSPYSRSLYVNHGIFLDSDLKVLRCTTRNERSLLPYATVFPIFLPSMVRNKEGVWEICQFSRLLVKFKHHEIGHQGVPDTLSNIRAEFWILQGRRFVQKVLKKCIICRMSHGPRYSESPSDALPEFRTVRDNPFSGCGVDFLGPFRCKDKPRSKSYKVWYLSFVCGSTRAVHVEACKSRNIDDFLLAMSRFMNHYGIPKSFISDHEGSFKRASQELEQIIKSKRVQKYLKHKRISWNFYTEKSPHKGGFIERLNSGIKKTFYKVLSTKVLSFEEFRTLACHVSSTLNDRPLTYLYSDIASENKALSPSMLLRGYNIHEPPTLNLFKPRDASETKISDSYIKLEKIKNSFWNIWEKQYLKNLFERHVRNKKANKELIVPRLGEVCLISEEKVPRRDWRLGRVVEIDVKRGAVRQVTVQTLSPGGKFITKLKRTPSLLVPIGVESELSKKNPEKLVPLEIDSEIVEIDCDKLVPLEGDPSGVSLPIQSSSRKVSKKYSKQQLARMKKACIWPPYKKSKQFLDPSSCNTGSMPDFVNRTSNPKSVRFQEELEELPRAWNKF